MTQQASHGANDVALNMSQRWGEPAARVNIQCGQNFHYSS